MTPVRQARTSGTIVAEVHDAPSPIDALDRLSELPGRVLLHSAGRGRYSILAADPVRVLSAGAGDSGRPDPFSRLEEILGTLALPPPPEGIPFAGGIIGLLGYEAGDSLERLPPPPDDDLGIPDAWFGVYDRAVVWDHAEGTCRGIASVLPGSSSREAKGRLDLLLEAVSESDEPREPAGRGSPPTEALEGIETSLSRNRFEDGVQRIRKYIREGDLFQANLTRRISVPTRMRGPELYRRLLSESPAEYSAFLDTGGAEVISISPELFLSVRAGEVLTRPIKGTAPRSSDAARDRRLAEGLVSSEKDRAENVMIVDLMRNDLSRVCLPGSIAVSRLAELETHPTVHHLVSDVRGTLAPGTGPVDLLRATFPGGSITGAPKIRAMEILRELEPVRRGVYTGALGIIGFHGDLDLSVAIRTTTLRNGRAHYGTGGGITLASDPSDEWNETEDKARAFFRALRPGQDTPPPEQG